MNPLNVEYRKVETLIPYARNPRTHTEAQIAKIAASIVEYGWTNPILVDGGNGIIAGHGRLAAARKLGLAEVPVIELAHLSTAQKRAYVIADNRLALDAGWDEEMLALELAELSEAGYELALTGFEGAELRDLLASAEVPDAGEQQDDAADDADDVPEAPATPVSRVGDVWAIGAHRLICGDAADADVVATLMAGEQAALCFTSPPYGNQRDYTTGGIADWDVLMRGVFAQLPMVGDGQVLVNLGLIHRDNEFVPYWEAWIGWMRTKGWRRFGWYVWDQGPGMPGDWAGRFAPSFEFVFHFNRASRKPNKIVPCKFAGQETHLRADGSSTAMRGKDGEVGGWTHAGQPTQDMRIPDSVIRVMRHKGKIGEGIDHPAVFPVALPQFVIKAFSDTGDLVFEPFGGSGSTMLAAQRTGRVCRSVEIAPEYVDVAIRRFRQNHPEVAVTLLDTGQTFDEVEGERIEEVVA
ncbi:site-specific DNA-methyltransferase [Pandoraea nosoerga]|uniref:site-specific DNA-methyltransferase n=1 Tax=Pandoraea nosoerga TaxID=2508296 RepID=UPI00197FDA46|nr:site-specific DNA-methyltransferase [Pandoraea nosoerga]MBN4664701.1 site-specific DNA-methyltransferase [Pandoraea nosoerga]MBN4674125.1 site-specific DNA-methyltransferase [Pandoraea nosoerga]MBN4679941.1 site-specific DNA-methyltransferase [Pandoraea nosoerga]MBN4744344.1 site-specific DNA-methyltransferase [Pandoraea nosoerga]